MQSSIEQLEGLARKLTVEVPAERVDSSVKERLKEIRSKARIDGFRPGKVPPQVIMQRYGAGVRQEVLGNLIDVTYREEIKKVVEEHQFEIAGAPEIELESGFQTGETLKYSAIFEIVPEVEVKGMDSITIDLPRTEINDDDVEEMINALRRQQATFSESTTAVKENDRVTVDFVGKVDGEIFEGGSGEGMQFQVGAGQMLPDFENGTKGMNKDEQKTFSVQFPEDYGSEDLAGKTAEFTVTVKKIEEMHLPEINEEFIKKFGLESGKESDFQQAIRDNMARELDNALRNIKRSYMFEAILSNNEEQVVPEVSVRDEIQRLASEMQLDKQIPDEKQRNELAERFFSDRARKNVRLSLLIRQLFKESELKLDEERVKNRINSIASTYENPEEVKEWYAKDKKSRNTLESAVLEEQLIDKLYESAAINYEDKKFREVMSLNTQLRN